MMLRGRRATTSTWFADGGESTQIGSSTGTKKVTTRTYFVLVWWLKIPFLTKPECFQLLCLTRLCSKKYILLDSSNFSDIIARFGPIIAKNHKPSRTFIPFPKFNSHQKAVFVLCNRPEFSKRHGKNWRTCFSTKMDLYISLWMETRMPALKQTWLWDTVQCMA